LNIIVADFDMYADFRRIRSQTPPNYLNKLTAAERRHLQIPESFLGPLAVPINSEAFTAFLKDRYALIRQDFIDGVRQGLFALAPGQQDGIQDDVVS
jgi:hypothetical protein